LVGRCSPQIHEGLLSFWPLFIGFLYVVNLTNTYNPARLLLTVLQASSSSWPGCRRCVPRQPVRLCSALGTCAPEGLYVQGAIGALDASVDSAVGRVIAEFAPKSLLTVALALLLSVGFFG
jgi:hypothetical protein